MSEPKMVDKKPCWTTSKEEADKLVDKLSEVCFEYGKNENNEKLLDVFYATKALKNYVGIMQGRIELLTARIAELEAHIAALEEAYARKLKSGTTFPIFQNRRR